LLALSPVPNLYFGSEQSQSWRKQSFYENEKYHSEDCANTFLVSSEITVKTHNRKRSRF
jgi:hypothetical protein